MAEPRTQEAESLKLMARRAGLDISAARAAALADMLGAILNADARLRRLDSKACPISGVSLRRGPGRD